MGSWTNANHILRDNRSSEVLEGVCHTGVIIELYQFTSVSGRFYDKVLPIYVYLFYGYVEVIPDFWPHGHLILLPLVSGV